MNASSELGQRVDAFLTAEVDRILDSVPYAGHLIYEDDDLDEEYYVRHRVETIKRIILTAKIDALALARMIEEDYDSSRVWARYATEELNHDILYRRDLHKHGYDDKIIDDILPLVATQDLGTYLTRRVEEIGSLAAVAYSLFVEWNSDRVSERVVARSERRFSTEHVSGSSAHVHLDKKLHHQTMVVSIAERLINLSSNERELFVTLRGLVALFEAYFLELYEVTVGRRGTFGNSTQPPPLSGTVG